MVVIVIVSVSVLIMLVLMLGVVSVVAFVVAVLDWVWVDAGWRWCWAAWRGRRVGFGVLRDEVAGCEGGGAVGVVGVGGGFDWLDLGSGLVMRVSGGGSVGGGHFGVS